MTSIKSLGSVHLDQIPIIETARTRLRPYRTDDLNNMETMWNDADYVRFIGNRTRSRQDLWKQLQSQIGSWSLLGFGYWIIEKHDGTFVGEAGFLEGVRDMVPSHAGTPEAGWGITPAFWGQGYAAEIIAAMLNWRDTHLDGNRTVCIIDPEHTVSIKLANKFGFKKAYRAQLGDGEIDVFERLG